MPSLTLQSCNLVRIPRLGATKKYCILIAGPIQHCYFSGVWTCDNGDQIPSSCAAQCIASLPIITRQYGFRMIPMCLLDDNPPQYLLVILQSVSPTIPTSEIGLGRHLLFDGGYAAEQLQQRYCATVGCSVVLVQLRGRWDKIAPFLVNLDFWWFLLVQRLDIPKAANLYDQSLHLVFFRFAFLERLGKWQEQHRTDAIAQKCGKMVSVTQQNSDDPLWWQNPVWLDTLFNGYSRAPADTAVNQDSKLFLWQTNITNNIKQSPRFRATAPAIGGRP